MSRTTGEALRLPISRVMRSAENDAVMGRPWTIDDYVRHVAAAIVEKLGITREMASRMDVIVEGLLGFGHPDSADDARRAGEVLTALLDCAEVEP